MGRWLYSLLMYLALPAAFAFLWYRGRRDPAYRQRLSQRLGYVPEVSEAGALWVHAASVGEVIAATPVIRGLMARFPDRSMVVTTMTPTGAERVHATFGDAVQHRYIPYDAPGPVNRFVSRLQPSLLVIMETEVWPNLVHSCARRAIPLILANARMSERSARGYARFGSFSRELFAVFDWVAAQATPDAERLRQLGVRSDRMAVAGSIKYDVSIDAPVREEARQLRRALGVDRPVWIAASTHEGEDEQALEAHRRLLETSPEALLVLVPRHRERFDSVFRAIDAAGLSGHRRSLGGEARNATVYLADTMGELLMLFGVVDVAFIGGSLIERGGHNPLEAAAWALPILTGPHVFNFATVFQRLEAEGGVSYVATAEALGDALTEMFEDPAGRRRMGEQAHAVVEANRGAVARLVDGIAAFVDQRP